MTRKSALRSVTIGGGLDSTGKQTVSTGVPYGPAVPDQCSWSPQQDVTVMKVNLIIEADVRDADTNADGEVKGIVELTKAGTIEQEGTLGNVQVDAIWNAAIALSGDLRKQAFFDFAPEGIDVDEDDELNLAEYFSYTGGAGPVGFYGTAQVWYKIR